MTNQELIDYYCSLLIMQYKSLPKANATIAAQSDAAISDQLPILAREAFNIDTAIGAQLDVLGKYVNISRANYTFTRVVNLIDDEYRTAIKMRIVTMSSGSSLYEIQNVIQVFFSGSLLVFDHSNMRMDYFFSTSIGSRDLAEIFVRSGLLPKPMGVQMGTVIYAASVNNLFGFRTYEIQPDLISGFNTYEDYDQTKTFLQYQNGLNY